ncbi:MAG: amidohydrolase family protein [Vulcanimicrobiota bacterium]
MSMTRHNLIKLIVLILFTVFSALPSWSCDIGDSEALKDDPPESPAIRYHINDGHQHYVDLVQNSDGIETLLREMDRLGVDHSMLSGFPVVKKWDIIDPIRPAYYLDNDSNTYYYSAGDVLLARAVSLLSPQKRSRIHPFICSFNPTDRNAVDHVKRMIEWYPGLWEGIGEVLTRHNYLSHMTGGEQARADHPALDPVYELAAEKHLPVNLHSDIGTPSLHDPIYLHEMENALKKHSRTHFFWAHGGFARNMQINGVVDIYRRLLATYPNLSIDMAGSFFAPIVIPGGKANKEIVDLIEEFPDRFTIGTDRIGHFGKEYQERIVQTYTLLDALKPGTAAKVARENFLKALPRQGVENLLLK